MIIVLLREYLLPWIEVFLRRSDCGALWANGQIADASDLNRVLNVSISFQTHAAKSWSVSGQQLGPPISYETATRDPIVLQRSYSWSIIPWGTDSTGLMLAFVSADERLLGEAKLQLNKAGCGNLIVNEYSAADVLEGKFRGLVFGRLKDDRGKGIWPYICGEGGSVLAFTRGSIRRGSLESNEIVGMEPHDQIYGRGICLRVKREDDFVELARQQVELMITDETAESYVASALANFDALQQDPLAFAINEFVPAKVLYVPGTARRHEEIVLCRSDSDAKQIGNSEQLKGSSMFELTCYC